MEVAVLTEEEVRELAQVLGYELRRTLKGYELVREYSEEEEVLESPDLLTIIDFLKQ